MADSPQPAKDLPPPPPEEKTVVVENQIRRLNWSLVVDATLGVFNAERGFWFTLRGFVTNPSAAFRGYLGEDRMRYSNPLKMVIFLSALTTFVMHQLQALELIEIGAVRGERTPEEEEVAAFAQRNYNLLLLSTLPLMALITRLFYWGRVYNFLEHLALNAFQVSVITVAYFVMLPTIALWPVTNFGYLVLALVYQTWLYRRVLGPGWFRATVATLVVTVAYIGTMSALGTFLVSAF